MAIWPKLFLFVRIAALAFPLRSFSCCVTTAVQWSDPGTHYLPLSGLYLILAQRLSCRQTFRPIGRLIKAAGFLASLRLAILPDYLSSELIQAPEDFLRRIFTAELRRLQHLDGRCIFRPGGGPPDERRVPLRREYFYLFD